MNSRLYFRKKERCHVIVYGFITVALNWSDRKHEGSLGRETGGVVPVVNKRVHLKKLPAYGHFTAQTGEASRRAREAQTAWIKNAIA